MKEDFKNKLEQYQNGNLPETERQDMEEKLTELELYQQILNDIMDDSEPTVMEEKKIIKRGKRKSWFANVFGTITALLGLWIGGMILSGFYYTPERSERYREVISIAVQATIPNVRMGGSGLSFMNPFIGNFRADLQRVIGNDFIHIGELEGNFFFSNFNRAGDLPISLRDNAPFIRFPEFVEPHQTPDFTRLEQLPDGTMAELYISFPDYKTMDEVFELMRGRNLSLRWLAVDTGGNKDMFTSGIARLGIPHAGFWLQQDFQLMSQEQNTTLAMHRGLEILGDVEFREEEFLTALKILQVHPRIWNNVALWQVDLDSAITHIKENGIKIAGIVITGPTPELLTLQDEPWIGEIQVGEVTFLNWRNSLD